MKRAVFLVGCLAAGGLWAYDLSLGMRGEVSFGDGDLVLTPVVICRNWAFVQGSVHRPHGGFAYWRPDEATGSATYDFYRDDKVIAHGRTSLVSASDGTARLSATLTALVDQPVEGIALAMNFDARKAIGRSWQADDKKGVFPQKFGKQQLFCGPVRRLVLPDPATGKPLVFSFSEPTEVLVQDSRRWVSEFSVRFYAPGRTPVFARDTQRAFFLAVTCPDKVTVKFARPNVVAAGKDWTVLDYRKDVVEGSALDFSGMGLNDAPAGKYGWLKAVGGRFEFERRPGIEQRFYGVNLCFDANYPDEKTARRLVTRLRRLGYNSLRIHHYERSLVAGSEDGLALDGKNLRKLDKLIALAIENGLYVTTDLFVSRPVKWRAIGIDRDGLVPMNMYKNLIALHEPAFENWKAFAQNLLTHVNPFTGRRYADEPGLPLVSFVNEGTMAWPWKELRTMPEVRKVWQAWLAEGRKADPSFAKGVPEDPSGLDFFSTAAVQRFMADTEARSSRRQRAFLHGLGARALVTSQNCDDNRAMAKARETYDYVDTHFYVDHPQFLCRDWRLPSQCDNRNPVQATLLSPVRTAYRRLAEMPFTVTEWNFSGPGMYRGVGGIMTGSLASLQAWNGLWRFAYAHGLESLNDDHSRPGYFDLASDPLGQASDRACVCLYLRGDLDALKEGVALDVGSGKTVGAPDANEPQWLDSAWGVQVARTTKGRAKGFRTYPFDEVAKELPFVPKGSAAVRLDRTRGTFAINTPKTAGGFAPSGRLEAGAIGFDVGDVAATVWASSLDARPLTESRRILLTHLTDVQADGNVYADSARRILLEWGAARPIVRNGRAKVELALANAAAYEVWGLRSDGQRLEKVASEVVGGKLCFTADVAAAGGARLCYEVVRRGQWGN